MDVPVCPCGGPVVFHGQGGSAGGDGPPVVWVEWRCLRCGGVTRESR